jgi:hypothetical protein
MTVAVRPRAHLAAALAGTAAALAGIAGCASGDAAFHFDPEPKPVAEVEAGALAQARRVAEMAGSPLTGWRTSIDSCDVANPGRAWALAGRAEISVPGGDRAAALRAVRDRFWRDNWEFGSNQPPPEASPSASGYIDVADPDSDFNLTVETGSALGVLEIVVDSTCYDAVDGENPANA